uniref:zinc finger and BTB domain-containing protein 17 isoform X3 n=1 Tax=Vespula vulgaris TaxID=7454 RepID=UPI00223B7413|nr:zinc finger and BTB domain-containing protein 17 isoform X3 [Vespula vulgaris]
MEDDQQFCLKWNNHQSTLIQNFDTLYESGTLVDCTLAAEGKYLKAHRVVLSACSPYFEGLLSEHYDKHPVFILKDVKFKELKAMMDYMYRGEVNISQDQLTALLKAAESLQIKGLSESKTGGGNNKTVSRVSKVAPQPRSSPLNISYASSGLTIERNRVPRQAQSSIGDLPEDSHSPQIPKELSSREGSQSPTSKKRRRLRRRSVGEDNSVENHEASNSSDIPQQMGVPALAIAPVADEKTNADPTDSLGRSALMTQLTKPADEMLQIPLDNPEPNDNLIEPKSEYLEDQEESVEDLTLDDDMNDLNEIEQDTNRAGPSHDNSQHPAGLATWHVTGDRSNAGGVVGSVAGAPGTTDEVFLAAQEAAQAHRDSQDSLIRQVSDTSFLHPVAIIQAKSYHQSVERNMFEKNLKKKRDSHFVFVEPEREMEQGNNTINDWPNNSMMMMTTTTTTMTTTTTTMTTTTMTINANTRKKFYCPKCNNGYSRLSDMKTHCQFQCGLFASFRSASQRLRYLNRYYRSIVRYPCMNCTSVYNKRGSLMTHLRYECGQPPRFKCPYCDMISKKTSNVQQHIRRKHKGSVVYVQDTRLSTNFPYNPPTRHIV